MPLRLSTLPIFALRCPYQSFLPTSQFHTSQSWKSDGKNYYETLGLKHNASAAEIKKQFYHLSKLHHPDHNPNDPTASTRFVSISTAYATLGSPSKRERYDRDLQRSSPVRTGSHSSSTSFGSRPPSGLSKRRTQFRGPPPSFYRSGGWGNQGAKRQAQADAAASAAASSAQSSASTAGLGGGFSPGQNPMGWSNDVPHFDRDGHFRTQEQQEQRRKKRIEEGNGEYSRSGGDVLLKFVVVGGVVALACGLPAMFEKGVSPVKKDAG